MAERENKTKPAGEQPNKTTPNGTEPGQTEPAVDQRSLRVRMRGTYATPVRVLKPGDEAVLERAVARHLIETRQAEAV